MLMLPLPCLSTVFVAIAVIFLGVTLQDYLRAEDKLTIARKVWIRMAFIFAGVAIGLYFVQTFFF